MSSQRPASLRREIVRSASFRLSLRFAGIFVACLILLDLGLGSASLGYIAHREKAALGAQLDTLEQAFAKSGEAGVRQAVEAAAADANASRTTVGYSNAVDGLLVGTLDVPSPDFESITFHDEGPDRDQALWVASAPLSGGSWVSAGRDSETYHDIRELMLAGAIWTIVIAFPLSVLSGALLSRTILHRLGEISQTADGVSEGDLSRRAPVLGTRDEFDRLAGNINAMLDTIESLTRNLRDISVGIAHELRTPLTHVRNRLIEMTERQPPEPLGSQVFGAIGAVDRALSTFDALLSIGRIEANPERKGFEQLDLSGLAGELAETYAPVAEEQGRSLHTAIAPGIGTKGNRMLLTQMIANLLENALEHTPPGTRVTLALETGKGGHRLIVADDGPGIPVSESERIFERFYRLDVSRSTPGNGLGLSLVRSICGLHGFTVALVPATVGARFEVSIPSR